MITMFRTAKGPYSCFSSCLMLAKVARRSYPELKGGRITNVLQGAPSKIKLGHLYKHDEDLTAAGSYRVKQGAALERDNNQHAHASRPDTLCCASFPECEHGSEAHTVSGVTLPARH